MTHGLASFVAARDGYTRKMGIRPNIVKMSAESYRTIEAESKPEDFPPDAKLKRIGGIEVLVEPRLAPGDFIFSYLKGEVQ